MASNNRYQPRYTNPSSKVLSESSVGAGISGGTGTVVKTSVEQVGDLVTTKIFIDVTGLGTSTTDLDIIGTGTSPAYITQIDTSVMGTITGGKMECLEVPTTGADDVDLYCATEGTGVFDGGIAALAETALVTSGAAWTVDAVKGFLAAPANGKYLYLCNGEAGTVGTYDAGMFLITLYGYK